MADKSVQKCSVEEGILEVHPSGGNASSADLVVECTPRARLLECPLPVLIPADVARNQWLVIG